MVPIERKNTAKTSTRTTVRDRLTSFNSVVLEAILGLSNRTLPLVSAEDVHVTGMLAREAGIGHVQIGNRYALASTDEEKIASGQTIFAHLGPDADVRMEQIWNYLVSNKRKRRIDLPMGCDKIPSGKKFLLNCSEIIAK
ncbi:hexosyltransferase [Caerostris extrusa]|uniref:Hexosyltransferase n=1 Tax=Caerostris extrusa TaxID=172846 RepID=A0AAV4TKT8_CAEEX|nr:hexosyltransferase [Caerostris extrusa]